MPRIARFEPFSMRHALRHASEAQELVASNSWLENTPYAIDAQQFASLTKALGSVARLSFGSAEAVGIIYDAEGRQPNGDYAPVRFPVGIGAVTFGYREQHPVTGGQLNCAMVDYWLTTGQPSMHSASARCLASYARSCLPEGRRLEAVLGTVEIDGEHQPAGVGNIFEEIGQERPRHELGLRQDSRYEPFKDRAATTQLYIASDITGIELGNLG